MTQIGEGQDASASPPRLLTYGAADQDGTGSGDGPPSRPADLPDGVDGSPDEVSGPTPATQVPGVTVRATPQPQPFGSFIDHTPAVSPVGEVLADRYKLEEHVNDDSLGRQVWRGSDIVLRRQVAVVLRYPGGNAATEMLAAAVAASRLVHPHLVGVYDAIDEGERAYVVREWVEGESLREVVSQAPLEPQRAVAVASAVADAVAAIHATDIAHGNIQPGSVLIGRDGRVVLADARGDDSGTRDADVRAVGAILYCALTGHWPHAEIGPDVLPDAPRDGNGGLCAPRQVRAGIPGYVDELVTGLLAPESIMPAADELAGELARLDNASEDRFFPARSSDSGGFSTFNGLDDGSDVIEAPRPIGRKIAIGVAALLVLATAGTLLAARFIGGAAQTPPDASASTPASAGASAGAQPVALHLTSNQVRIVDGKGGDRTELTNAGRAVDGNPSSGWDTDHYNQPAFGNRKSGMGVLIDLGETRQVTSVEVQLSRSGSTIELRWGKDDPGSSASGDAAVEDSFARIDEPVVNARNRVAFPVTAQEPIRYLMVWLSKLPPDGDGRYQIEVKEITVRAR